MNTTRFREDTPATLAIALALWGLGTVLAAFTGAFAKFSPGFIGALAAFAFGFATVTTYLDFRVRATIGRMPLPVLALFAAALLALSASLLFMLSGTARPLASVPFVAAALFGAPLGGALAVSAVHRALRERNAAPRVRSARRLTSALG